MAESAEKRSEKRSLFEHLHAILLVVALVYYGVASFYAGIPAIHGLADEHGYLTTARQLVVGHSFGQRHEDPYAFIGETFMQSPGDAEMYYLRQPIGYPVLCAAAYAIGGRDAPFYVNPICGLAVIAAVYVIGRQLGGERGKLPAAIAAFFLAAHPIFLYYTMKPLSHLPDMAFSAWAMAVLLQWRRKGGAGWAVLGGVLMGMATLIRYTNVLLLIPFAVIVVERMRGVRREERRGIFLRALVAPVVMAVTLIPLLMYHATAFGSAFRTGYSAGGNATSFSVGWFFEHAPAMAEILASPSTGLSLLLVAVATGIGILGAKRPFVLVLLLAWALPSLILYTAYYGKAATNMLLYARFALASFVPLVLLGVVWLGGVGEMRPRFVNVITAVVAALAGGGMALGLSAMLETNAELQRTLVFCDSAAALLRKNVPAGSVVFAENDLQYAADYAGDYIVYSPSMYAADQVAARVADLQQTPHEFDPVRTRQIEALLGHRDDAELLRILHERLAGYIRRGVPVYVLRFDQLASGIVERAGLVLTRVETNKLETTVYRVGLGVTGG